MKIGFIGLGRMGKNMVLNLLSKKHGVVVYNRSPQPIKEMERQGAIGAYNIEEFIKKLPEQKIIWIMISAGKPVDIVISNLLPYLKRGDIIIDGGNSYYKDSIRRNNELKKKGIHLLDCGTSGGIKGARYGACMMIGGNKQVFKKIENIFKDMCVKDGYGYMGKSGAGHFVKMVHNGIEYGMMGAIAEGMEVIRKYNSKFKTNLKDVSKVYAHGSIIAGRLMSWLWNAFQKKSYLESISCEVPKGETEDEMEKLEHLADMPILHQARLMRVRTRKGEVCGRIIAALRNEFGGHKVKKK
jgi:6-phosphogluconate dehydrogenase